MIRSSFALISALCFAPVLSAQVVVSLPHEVIPDAIHVTGTCAVDATATVGATVDPGGDANGGLGHLRFEADVGSSATSRPGKSEVHGPVTAVDTGSSWHNRGVFNSYTDVGGRDALVRNGSVSGSATFAFNPVAPFSVEGYFILRLDGDGRRFNGGDFTASATVTAAGATLTRTQANPSGGSTVLSGIVQLPSTGVISHVVSTDANAAGSRARTTIRSKVEFVPTRIWIEAVVIWPGVIGTPEVVIYERG